MAASSSSSSSRHLLNAYAPTAAPPPTPSAQPTSSTCSAAAVDSLSLLLHRLPPNLSLPTRFSSSRTAASPTITPTTPTPTLSNLSPPSLSSALELGFFQLATHSISPQLAESAESESLSLSSLPRDQKLGFFPKDDWPLGFYNDDDEDENDEAASFCLDGACSTTAELRLASLRELTRELEKLGLEVVESLACAVGFENPFEGKVGPTSLMWISEGEKPGRVYPYVVGLQYQIRTRKYSLLSDSGTVVVEPKVGSVLVTLGDIAQVWSNGKVKKVRGRPTLISEKKASKSHCISMTLLLTLPLESTISPLILTLKNNPSNKTAEPNDPEIEAYKLENNAQNDHEIVEKITSNASDDDNDDHQRVFNSFSFEDYAWRVYHERLPLKDPLDRYRVVLN